MANIDTLKIYMEFIESGYTEQQANTAIKSLNMIVEPLITKIDLHEALQKVEARLKIFFIYLVVGTTGSYLVFPSILASMGLK
jgi:hypothetical protein